MFGITNSVSKKIISMIHQSGDELCAHAHDITVVNTTSLHCTCYTHMYTCTGCGMCTELEVHRLLATSDLSCDCVRVTRKGYVSEAVCGTTLITDKFIVSCLGNKSLGLAYTAFNVSFLGETVAHEKVTTAMCHSLGHGDTSSSGCLLTQMLQSQRHCDLHLHPVY